MRPIRLALWTTLLATMLLGAGCGGGDSAPPPVDHALETEVTQSTLANSVLVRGPYQLPEDAVVSWTVVDVPSESGPNSLDVALATAASVDAGGTLVAFGTQTGVSSTTGETQPLPANNAYDFVAFCRNPVADCTFTLTLTATY